MVRAGASSSNVGGATTEIPVLGLMAPGRVTVGPGAASVVGGAKYGWRLDALSWDHPASCSGVFFRRRLLPLRRALTRPSL